VNNRIELCWRNRFSAFLSSDESVTYSQGLVDTKNDKKKYEQQFDSEIVSELFNEHFPIRRFKLG